MDNVIERLGKYFGYPKCCVKSYDDILNAGGRKTPEQMDPKVHQSTEFIPCQKHAEEILEGKRTLQSLIGRRVCPLPFPMEPDIGEINEYLDGLTITKQKRRYNEKVA